MKFILTNELGKLARWLRIMGFDAVYFKSNNIGTLIIQALREDRIIVTRRQSKIDDLEKKTVVLKNDNLNRQLNEVINKLNLKINENEIFTRCAVCNEILVKVKKEEVKDFIPEHVYKTKNEFRQCVQCNRVYWQGSHWGNIKEVIIKLGEVNQIRVNPR